VVLGGSLEHHDVPGRREVVRQQVRVEFRDPRVGMPEHAREGEEVRLVRAA
jgi:hypothetical protein